MMRLPLVPRLAALVFALGIALALLGCGNCPKPSFPAPGAAGAVTARPEAPGIVVRWAATPDDPVSTGYYGFMVPKEGMTTSLPPPVLKVTQRMPRELLLEIADPGALLRSGTALAIRFEMPDTRFGTDCHHPGMPDSYFVTLTLAFPPTGEIVGTFSPVTVAYGPL